MSTFNGDGTGTIKGTIVGINVPPTPGPGGYPHFPPGASSSTYSYSFNYAVDGEGGWTATMVPGTYAETFVTGDRAGQNQHGQLNSASCRYDIARPHHVGCRTGHHDRRNL